MLIDALTLARLLTYNCFMLHELVTSSIYSKSILGWETGS